MHADPTITPAKETFEANQRGRPSPPGTLPTKFTLVVSNNDEIRNRKPATVTDCNTSQTSVASCNADAPPAAPAAAEAEADASGVRSLDGAGEYSAACLRTAATRLSPLHHEQQTINTAAAGMGERVKQQPTSCQLQQLAYLLGQRD